MLLSPNYGNKTDSFSNRIKRIIFDEVHCIGQADDGLIWEQLLLQAPCPIIALSATVGNPYEFSDWLSSTQKANGHELVTIQHPHRYSDLRKFIYVPPSEFTFSGLREPLITPVPGLDQSREFSFIHPVACLINPLLGIPEDLNLEPRDCLQLLEAMKKHATADFPIPPSLDHDKLPDLIKKIDVSVWERDLRSLLWEWMACSESPFKMVRRELSSKVASLDAWADRETLGQSALPMLSELHRQNALPALLFSYDRGTCEKTAMTIMKELEEAEEKFRKTNPKWLEKLEVFKEWQAKKESVASTAKKSKRKQATTSSGDNGQKGSRDGGSHKGSSQRERMMEDASAEYSKWESFDPNAPIDEFSFANQHQLLPSEFKELEDQLIYRGVQEWLINALSRGIGVHHAGMNRKYRQAVEMLFRKGFLRVVIATGTLSLGINMPCKTVVFSGDSIYLTALNYRQSSGRAGRRGFDVLGNIVFQGMPTERVFKIMSSKLPDLHGHFPLTTSLVLRLCILLNETNQSQFAVRSINAILEQPRLCLGSNESKMAVLHHLRFSIEYLRRQHLVDSIGAPINLAGLVSHLYYTDNSCWGFHAMFKRGYFHSICSTISQNPDKVCRELMLVMAHLFCRIYIERQDSSFLEKVKHSASVVFLPPLPEKAEAVLRAHNEETLAIFTNYVDSYVNQHLLGQSDNKLPLTKLTIGASETMPLPSFSNKPSAIRSSFVALSGHGDSFSTISELCGTVRSDVFLAEAVVPYQKLASETTTPLNAYLYDFYRHGDKRTLEGVNHIRGNDLWFILNDFSLILATITTSLANLINGSDGAIDMTDIRGSADALEEQKEDIIHDSWEQNTIKHGDKFDLSNLKSALEARDMKETLLDSPDLEDSKTFFRDNGDTLKGSSLPCSENGIEGMENVLKAFELLKTGFDDKFKAIWA
jgi:ATP-dependent RNA helicase DDX60